MKQNSREILLLIARPQSYRISPYLFAARQMGLKVLLASDGEHSLTSEIHDGLHIHLENFDKALDTIICAAQKTPFCGVLGCDDSTVELAARVAQQLQLPHNPPQAARLSRRKDLSRVHLLKHGCAVPQHYFLDLNQNVAEQLTQINYPCVVKPVHLSASRGVIRANNKEELITACERIKPIITAASDVIESTRLIVEDYIDGVEVAYEGFLCEGQLQTLAIFDKPIPLVGPFFEESIYVTPSQLSIKQQQQIHQSLSQACDAYGLSTGPIHAELRIDEKNAWILEIASRTIGGDCGRTLDNSEDGNKFTIEELAISLAIGKKVDSKPVQGSRGVMMIPIPKAGILNRVDGLAAAGQVEFIDKIDIIISPGHELVPTPEGEQYPGYIFARAETPQQVITALQNAHSKLKFIISPLWKINGK
ncbi:MAG: ATP-grasp domain-containing protein [Pseudomonadota bacterium]